MKTYFHFKFADGIVSKYLLLNDSNLKWPKADFSRVRPIFMTFDLAPFDQVGEHEDTDWVLLPHQVPKVGDSFGQWSCV